MDLQAIGNQAVALFQQGNVGEAERLCLVMLGADPRNFLALHLRGLIRFRLGRLDEARALLGAALQSEPRSAQAHTNLGNILAAAGERSGALASYDRALALGPQPAETYCNRGNVLSEMGRLDEAMKSFGAALARNPGLAEALLGKSNVLSQLGHFAQGLAVCDQALALHPNDARLLNNRAVVLCGLHRFQEALADCDHSLAIRPDPVTLAVRGSALLGLQRFDAALVAFDAALVAHPRRAEMLINRGHALRELGRLPEALASYDQALALEPDNALALVNRAIALSEERRFADALASLEKAMVADPSERHALGLAANAALELCDWPRSEVLGARLAVQAAAHRALVPPLVLPGLNGDKALQLSGARDYVQDRLPTMPPALWTGETYRHDRIRLAYISSDFCEHPVAAVITQLLECHDRTRFEVLGISTGEDDGSAARKRFEKAFDRFVDVRKMDDHIVAQQMRALEVDIAIDLNGHTKGARPGILACRPAPVQVNYMGYPATMGADFIDYIIADATIVPMQDQAFFSERIVHLPDTFWVNDSLRSGGPTPTRAEMGLPTSGFVFCCFNQARKITKPLFDIWMRLLGAVPGSVLWLAAANPAARVHLEAAATARGIDPARLVFAPRLPDVAQHLARQRLADLFLDTLPYNAHTTACDALWMGVPVVTCLGQAFAGRVAASLLRAAGLPELVTETLQDYEAFSMRVARDPELLRELRQRLEAGRDTCALFDTNRFRLHIEAAFATMVATSRRGEAPQAFAIPPRD